MKQLGISLVLIAFFYVSPTIQETVHQNEPINWTGSINVARDDFLNQKFHASFYGDSNHTFALLNCTNFSATSFGQCDLTIVTHFFDNHTDTKICKIEPLTLGNEIRIKNVEFLRGNKILLTWEGKHIAYVKSNYGWHRHLQIISTDNCAQGDFFEIGAHNRDDTNKPYFIVPTEESCYVIHENEYECVNSKYCVSSFDYEGVKGSPQAFPGEYISNLPDQFKRIKGVHSIGNKYNPKFVIIGNMSDIDGKSEILYSPIMDYIKVEDLLDGSYAFSNSSGFATFCWREYNDKNKIRRKKITCKWIDGTHGDKQFSVDSYFYDGDVPEIYNTRDGNILLVTSGVGAGSTVYTPIIIEEARIDNKCRRLGQLIVPGRLTEPAKFSYSKDNKFCISGVQVHQKEDKEFKKFPVYDYTFATWCIELKDTQNFGECGSKKYDLPARKENKNE